MIGIGSRIGPYRVDGPLGRGAMGEVFRAHDTRLGRDVAIKIIPADLSHDADCRVRFDREARLLAAINHPHIATIYGIEDAAPTSDSAERSCALVMELVEGPTLAERIATRRAAEGRGQRAEGKGQRAEGRGLPIAEAQAIAAQLADALAAAHAKGIVHRDLKPANIKVTREGAVKVLDFGLATAVQGSAASELETMKPVSSPGMVIGTATYMSPEQVRGQPVDHRSDIWAFGCVFYEMLTGKPVFSGPTVADIMAATLDREPDWSALPASTPSAVRRLLKRCLEKDAAQRPEDIGAARADLETVRRGLPWRVFQTASLVAIGVGVAIAGVVIYQRRSASGLAPAPVPLSLSFAQMTADPGIEWFPNLSPDGKWIVYGGDRTGNRDIYLQSVTGQTPIDLTTDSPDDDDEPAFSPDGERIAFWSGRDGGGIFVMGRTGESLRRITRTGGNPSWSPDGKELLYTTERVEMDPQNTTGVSAMVAVNVATGAERRIEVPDAVLAAWSPHGRRIAYTSRREVGGARKLDVWTCDPDGGNRIAVTTDGALNWNPIWSPDGRFLYFSSARGGATNLWRVPIGESAGKTLGQPESLTAPTPFIAHLTMSKDGSVLAYSSVLRTRNVQRAALDPVTGAVKGEPQWVTTGSRTWANPDPSPDGKLVAFYSSPQSEFLYVARPDGSGLRQVTTGSGFTDRVPRWSPDGRWIAFFSNRSGGYHVWKVRPDGSEMQQLTEVPDASFPAWSPDGSRIAVTMTGGPGHPDDHSYVFDPNRPWKEQQPDVLPPAKEASPFIVNSWSRDGTLLAGQDGLGSRGVLTYSLRTRTYDRFTDYGGYPSWLPDSRRLIFVSGGKDFILLDTASRTTRKVLSVQHDVVGPAQLSRDGREMYFSRRVTEADIWLLKMSGGPGQQTR